MSASDAGPSANQIALTDLTLEQLQQVRQQLEEELQHLSTAFQELKMAQIKFSGCIDSLDSIKPANQDKSILIPLTSSLYVPGKISDPNKVLVDVGTGYYIEKTTKQAKQYYNTKILTLRSSLQTLSDQLEKKEDNLRSAQSVWSRKMQLQQQQQQLQQQGGGGEGVSTEGRGIEA